MPAENKTAQASAGGGLGFGGALTLLFIGLKLTGYIDWSWVWVLSPLWIPLVILAAILVCGFAAITIAHFLEKKGK